MSTSTRRVVKTILYVVEAEDYGTWVYSTSVRPDPSRAVVKARLEKYIEKRGKGRPWGAASPGPRQHRIAAYVRAPDSQSAGPKVCKS